MHVAVPAAVSFAGGFRRVHLFGGGGWSARDKGMVLRAQAVPRPKLSKDTEKPTREQRHSKDTEKPAIERRHSKSSTKTLRVKPDKAEIEGTESLGKKPTN